MHFVTAFIVIAIMHFNRCEGLMIMLWSSLNELAGDLTFEHFMFYLHYKCHREMFQNISISQNIFSHTYEQY